MPEVYNPLAAKVVLAGVLQGELYNTVLYVAKTDRSAWGADDVVSLAVKAKAFWEEDLRDVVSNQLALREFRAQVMQQSGGFMAATSSLSTGAMDGQAYANSVALVVTANTGLAGRANRGRIYQGGLLETDINGNAIESDRAAAIVLAWNSWIVRLSETGTAPMQPVVYSRFLGKVRRATAQLTTISSYSVRDLTIDSQRRRLPGRGR